MEPTRAQKLAAFGNLVYIRWLLGHVNELKPILAAWAAFQAAPDLTGKLAAIASLFEIIKGIVADVPQAEVVFVGASQALKQYEVSPEEFQRSVQNEAAALNFNWDSLMQIVALIQQLFNLFGHKTPAPPATAGGLDF